MKCFTLLSVALIPIVISQEDVVFKNVDEGDINARVEGDSVSEDDVNTRFINFGTFDLNAAAGAVGAAALGTIVGNTATNLAGNFLNNCNNRGKRSILMHKLEKRQAIEANERTGNPNADPEVASRIFPSPPCPQAVISAFTGDNQNNDRYCDRCYCSDRDCRNVCNKCGTSGNNNYGQNTGWSSNSGNNNYGQNTGWSSNSGNNNYGQVNGWSSNSGSDNKYDQNNGWNNNNGAHSHDNDGNKFNNNGQQQGVTITEIKTVNCNICYCRDSSCKKWCNRCNNNSHNFQGNNGGSHNHKWRSAVSENVQTIKKSEDTDEDPIQGSNENKENNNNNDSVKFG